MSGLDDDRSEPQETTKVKGPKHGAMIALGAAFWLMCTHAVASPGDANETVAEALFTDAKALMAVGKYGEACPKLEESQRLDAGIGTQLALVSCLVELRTYARAWTVLREAAPAAERQGRPDRLRLVTKLQKEVDEHVGFVRFEAERGPLPSDARIELDQTPVSSTAVGTMLPVDPGDHVVRVVADQGASAALAFLVHPGERKSVALPQVVPAVPRGGGRPLAPTERPRLQSSREPAPTASSPVPGFVVTGLGVAALGVGSVFGVMAIGDSARSKELCPELRCSSLEAIDANDRAKSYGTASTILFPVGAVLAGIGAVLIWKATRAPAPPPSIAAIAF